jgi:hypothetical protein
MLVAFYQFTIFHNTERKDSDIHSTIGRGKHVSRIHRALKSTLYI